MFDFPTNKDDTGILRPPSIQQVSLLSDDRLKGIIIEGALPTHLLETIVSLPQDLVSAISSEYVAINSATGRTEFNQKMADELPDDLKNFIDTVSQEFNKTGSWPKRFGIVRNLPERKFARVFHLESESAGDPRVFRGIISVSDTPEDRDHETEYIVSEGLTRKEIMQLKREPLTSTPIDQLPDEFRQRARVITSGDMFLTKGMGDSDYNNPISDGIWHRSPPSKSNYTQQSKRRTTLIWERNIAADISVG